MRRFLILAIGCAATFLGAASRVDWKAFNAGKFGSVDVFSFYEADRVERLPNNHVQVWTKGLPASDLMKRVITDQEAKDAADRLLKGYVPPINKIFPHKDNTQLVAFEMFADAGDISPVVQTLYEIDCGNKQMRILTLITKDETDNVPTLWQHMPPQSTGENLMTLVCQ